MMLLLSWPSLKRTTSCRRPGGDGCGERDGKAVEDRAASGGAERRERRVGGRRRIGEIDEPADAHVEGDQPQPIARAEIRSQLPQRSTQLVEDRSGHAGADIEQDRDVDRQLLVADVGDRLRHAVVEELEVRGGQADDRPPVAPDRGLDADDVGAGTEDGGRILRGGLADDRPRRAPSRQSAVAPRATAAPCACWQRLASSSSEPAQIVQHRRIRAKVAQPVRPPGVEFVFGGGLRRFGERRRFLTIAAIDEERHERDSRGLRARPGRERGAERGDRVVGAAPRSKDLAANQVGKIPHFLVR